MEGMNVEPTFDYQFRVILIGNSTVGKSSLLKYFTEGIKAGLFEPTVGVDFFTQLVQVEPGVKVKLMLWDTAGQERFRSITRTYYRNAVGVLMVFDISCRQSFEDMLQWLHEALEYVNPSQATFLVVGQKCDKESERVVSYAEGLNFAEVNGLRYMETSALTGYNVEEAFSSVARSVYLMFKSGVFELSDDFDGIRRGYGSQLPYTRFQVGNNNTGADDEEPGLQGCCRI